MIFPREGIEAKCFIAPGRTYDGATLSALTEVGLAVVNDGFFLCPGRDRMGLLWAPQQLWRIRSRPFGVWTICFHVNNWGSDAIEKFQTSLWEISDGVTDFESPASVFSGRNLRQHGYVCATAMKKLIKLKKGLVTAETVVISQTLSPDPRTSNKENSP